MEQSFKIEANGDYPFTFYIEKAVLRDEGDDMVIEGVASTTNVDHDNERMAVSALESMVEVINSKTVPLRVEHMKEDNAVVGQVFKAWMDDRNQMWIKAILDKGHPASGLLYKSLKEGVKLGLSVGGRVKHAVKELAEGAGKMVKTFYQVILDEVSVTQHPANYDSYLLRKSINKEVGADSEAIYKDFIFETRANDYLYAFAKSIPDEEWKKSDLIKYNDDMKKTEDKEMETEEKSVEADGTQEATPVADEKGPEESTNKSTLDMVVKSLENITNILTKSGLIKSESEDKAEETTIMEEKTESEDAEKSETEDETKEKSEDDTEEKAETEDENGSAYKMKSILSRLEGLAKSHEETEDKEKSEDKEDETTEKSATDVSDIDQFVDGLEKAIGKLEDTFTKSGKSVPGLRAQILNVIHQDKELQKSIKDMVAMPGRKQSVSMGVPFMKSKDGRAFRLTAVDAGEEKVTKSQGDKPATFAEMYKSEYSSVAEATRNAE